MLYKGDGTTKGTHCLSKRVTRANWVHVYEDDKTLTTSHDLAEVLLLRIACYMATS